MSDPGPHDLGIRCKPEPWVNGDTNATDPDNPRPATGPDHGKVDFETPESETVATVYVERLSNSARHVVHVQPWHDTDVVVDRDPGDRAPETIHVALVFEFLDPDVEALIEVAKHAFGVRHWAITGDVKDRAWRLNDRNAAKPYTVAFDDIRLAVQKAAITYPKLLNATPDAQDDVHRALWRGRFPRIDVTQISPTTADQLIQIAAFGTVRYEA